MARQTDVDIDHIDPRWEEGRDYQLVCGFEKNPKNLREEDWKKNTAKSNRFLPWRWCRDEIGVVPEEGGDFALFLVGADIEKDIPGEWVLMEFLSEEWFEETKETAGYYQFNLRYFSDPEVRRTNGDRLKEARKRWARDNPEECLYLLKKFQEGFKKWAEENPDKEQERRDKCSSHLEEYHKKNFEFFSNLAKQKNSEKWMCTITGKVSNKGGLSMYQKARGIDHKDPNNRIQIN